MAPLSRFLHPYYVANTALVLSWGVLRVVLDADKLQNKFMGTFLSGEAALFVSMTLYLYKKFKRCNTWDSFVAKSFLFYQTLIAFMLWYVSLAAMVWYGLAVLASFFVFRLPAGGDSPNITELDDISFEVNIASKAKAKRGDAKDDVAWLVFFTANWHNECTFFSYVFADMADKFGGTDKIRFGRLDDRHKAIFEANKVEADQWKPLSLPCVVMFKNGGELLRLPPFDERGNLIATLMTYKGCVKYFGLEKRLENVLAGRTNDDLDRASSGGNKEKNKKQKKDKKKKKKDKNKRKEGEGEEEGIGDDSAKPAEAKKED